MISGALLASLQFNYRSQLHTAELKGNEAFWTPKSLLWKREREREKWLRWKCNSCWWQVMTACDEVDSCHLLLVLKSSPIWSHHEWPELTPVVPPSLPSVFSSFLLFSLTLFSTHSCSLTEPRLQEHWRRIHSAAQKLPAARAQSLSFSQAPGSSGSLEHRNPTRRVLFPLSCAAFGADPKPPFCSHPPPLCPTGSFPTGSLTPQGIGWPGLP